jgi:hypothetical protein
MLSNTRTIHNKRVLEKTATNSFMWTDPKFNKPTALLRLLNADSVPDLSPYYGKRTIASRRRVVGLLQAINRATAMLDSAVEIEPDRNYWTDAPKDLREALEEIDDILAEYPMRPTVEISGKYGDGGLHFDHANGSSRPLGEQLAVWDITTLAQKKMLERVRECMCGEWFFARRKDKTACSAICRHKTYEQSERFKVQRRQYMRNYYKLKQSGKVR